MQSLRSNTVLTIGAIIPFLTIWICILVVSISITKQPYLGLDDGYIHLELARNFINGNGFAINPGEPISASTAPFFTAIMILLGYISPHLVWNNLFFNLLCSIGSIILMYTLCATLFRSKLYAFSGGVILSVQPWFIWSAYSGMEVSLSILLVTTAIFIFIKSYLKTNQSIIAMTIVLGFLTQVRPEMYSILLIFLLFACYNIASNRIKNINTISSKITWIFFTMLIPSVIILPYALFAHAVTSGFLPNTFYAKTETNNIFYVVHSGENIKNILTQLYTTAQSYVSGFANYSPFYIIGGYITIILVFLYGLFSHTISIRNKTLFYCIPLIFEVAIICIVGNQVSYPWNRHLLPLLPIFTIWILYALSGVSAMISRFSHNPSIHRYTFIVAVVLIITENNAVLQHYIS